MLFDFETVSHGAGAESRLRGFQATGNPKGHNRCYTIKA